MRGGRETLPFGAALDQEPVRLVGEEVRTQQDPTYYSHAHQRFSYMLRGRYMEQLRRWLEHYPRCQLLVMQSERLFREPARAMATVYRFLGLREHRLERYPNFLDGQYGQAIPEAEAARLRAHFAGPNSELFQWLGEEFDWGRPLDRC